MNANTPQQSTRNLGPEPHTWERGAEYLTVVKLGEPMLGWLRKSGLPGTESIDDDGTWLLQDRVRFLKRLCGEGP